MPTSLLDAIKIFANKKPAGNRFVEQGFERSPLGEAGKETGMVERNATESQCIDVITWPTMARLGLGDLTIFESKVTLDCDLGLSTRTR